MRDRADEGSTGTPQDGSPDGAGRPAADGAVVLRVSGVAGSGTAGSGAAGSGAEVDAGAAGGGPMLVLAAPDGTTFHLPVDGTLRAAIRSAAGTPETGPVPVAPLRPKDIQTRIRAGESATELAEASGAPLEQIERYAGPVLAERAHIATVARATVVRTTRSRPTLEDLVRHRLASRGVALGTVAWDAWRRGEHGWALQVSFRAGTRDRLAQWSYDPVGESVEPLDDEARWLSSSHEAEGGGSRRLSSVRVFDVENDGELREVPVVPGPPLLGDTGSMVRQVTGEVTAPLGGGVPEGGPGGAAPGTGGAAGAGSGPWSGPDHDEVAARTMDLLDALSDRRGRRQPMPDLGPGGGWDDDEDDEDDDLVEAFLVDLPPGAHPAPPRPGEDDLAALLAPPPEPHLRAVPAPASWAVETAEVTPVEPAPSREPSAPEARGGPARGRGADEDAAGEEQPDPARPGFLGLVPRAQAQPGGDHPAARAGEAGPELDLRDADRRPAGTDGEQAGPPDGARDPAEDTGPVPPVRSRSTRRPSVPSWDEIVFGSPRTDSD